MMIGILNLDIRKRRHRFAGKWDMACVVILIVFTSLYPVSGANTAPVPGPSELYTFDEGAGATARDQKNPAERATLVGNPHWFDGIHGTGVRLDSTLGQYIDLSHQAVNMSKSFTISLWIRLNSLDGLQSYVSESGDNNVAFALQKNETDDRFCLYASDSDSAGAKTAHVESDFSPTRGQWYQLTGVYDKEANKIRLYADGMYLKSGSFSPTWTAAGSKIVGAGKIGDAAPVNFADAEIDQLRIYDRPLTDGEVSELYSNDLRAFQPRTFTWTNPIYYQGDKNGDEVHDPDVINDRGIYYMVATLAPFANFTYRDPNRPNYGSAPGIAIYSSRDLKVWKFEDWLYKSSDIPDTAPYKHQFWAPEIHKIDGRYYIIFGASNWIADKYNITGKMGYYQFIAVADKVTGPYEHTTALQGPGVDTSLFQDDDGKTYVVWPWNEIHPVDLSQIDRGIVTVGPKISQTTTPDQFRANGHDWHADAAVEGPYMIKHGGIYYSLYACNYGGVYATGVSTATSLSGPWTLDPRGPVFNGGHQSEFIGPNGQWWACDKHENTNISQWVSIDPITFGSDGRLNVIQTNTPQSIQINNYP
jgi:xylan 1,4-beta-xylosidase